MCSEFLPTEGGNLTYIVILSSIVLQTSFIIMLILYGQVVNDLHNGRQKTMTYSANVVYVNTTNKRRRHGYAFQTSSKGGRVRGRKTGWRFWMFEDTKIATWRSDEARRLSRAVRQTRGRRPKMIDCLRRSCAPCLHDQVQNLTTVASEKDVIDCRAWRHRTCKETRCVVIWGGGAVDWCILFEFWPQVVYGLVYFSPGRKWSCEMLKVFATTQTKK